MVGSGFPNLSLIFGAICTEKWLNIVGWFPNLSWSTSCTCGHVWKPLIGKFSVRRPPTRWMVGLDKAMTAVSAGQSKRMAKRLMMMMVMTIMMVMMMMSLIKSHVHGACKPLTTEATGGLFRNSHAGSVGMVNFT